MLKLLKIVLVLLVVMMLAIVGLFLAAIESEPLLNSRSGEQVGNAESVNLLMKQLSDSVKNRESKQRITITEDQLNSLVGFTQRAFKPLNGHVTITPKSSRILASYQLPKNPIGQYINVDVMILPGNGLSIEHVKVGPFSVPGKWVLTFAVSLANWYTNSDIAKTFVNQVEHVAMSSNKVVLSVRPLDEFLKELDIVKQSVGGTGDEELRLRTAYYLMHLSELEVGKKANSQSLAKYMGPLFGWAKQRSNYETAAQENEAAIMALAIYAGHYRFASFVGEVQPVADKLALPKASPMLRFRGDLNQHFIFSAAIKILSEQGLSLAIGEFKELMDRSKNGSGYSFVDLAADFAGVAFAESATDPNRARLVQEVLADKYTEKTFFPPTKDLPEGLRKAEFVRQFKEVDSPEYQQMVNSIHNRIAKLPIHAN